MNRYVMSVASFSPVVCVTALNREDSALNRLDDKTRQSTVLSMDTANKHELHLKHCSPVGSMPHCSKDLCRLREAAACMQLVT